VTQRRRSLVAAALLVALLAPAATGAASAEVTAATQAGTPNATTPTARIEGAVPNPTADGDDGEFVAVRVPPDSTANWTLDDGEGRVALPANRSTPVVAVSDAPAAARPVASVPVHGVPSLALSNAGERLRLRRDGETVDTLAYDDAPEGERLVRAGDGVQWRPVGFHPRDVHAYGPANVTGFVLPDSPDAAVAPLRQARERILLAGYTFSDERVADALVAAERRGVAVRVLLDADPVGGMSVRQARTLDRLVAAGVEVAVLGGPHARFDYHHPKYAVADDRAVVLTENWKPAGVGGASSRGWGVTVRSAPVADDLAALFRHDAGGRDATPWAEFRRGETFEDKPPAEGSYPSRVAPTTATAASVRVLTAPGNAEGALVGVIDGAERRVDVVQPTVGRPDGPLLRATIRAAERGVEVRILLSGAWYAVEENRALVDRLNRVAERRDLPLSARVAEPRGRFEKIHAKGVVADDVVVVGSLNWNENAVADNREVAVAVRSERLAAGFRDAFVADWRGDDRRTTVVVVAGAVAAVLVAVAVARRAVAFD
jgi:phosphatidylserine/phosphatidylglycerophosphate/cardiolipin synthase-like enzyme